MPFLIGQLIGILLFVGLDFLIIKIALNMINAKKKKLEKIQLQNDIESIGN